MYEEDIKRRQKLNATLAGLMAEAKSILQDAKQIAADHDMVFDLEGLVQEVTGQQMWHGSDASLC